MRKKRRTVSAAGHNRQSLTVRDTVKQIDAKKGTAETELRAAVQQVSGDLPMLDGDIDRANASYRQDRGFARFDQQITMAENTAVLKSQINELLVENARESARLRELNKESGTGPCFVATHPSRLTVRGRRSRMAERIVASINCPKKASNSRALPTLFRAYAQKVACSAAVI